MNISNKCRKLKLALTKDKGFTLIEILVVIGIISLLATIILVNAQNSKRSAKNTKRITDIRAYINAFHLELDKNEEFPDPDDTSWHCLGDYSDDRCWHNGKTIKESTTLNNILNGWINLPADQNLICGYNNNPNQCYEGYIYQCTSRPSNKCNGLAVRWFLEGPNRSCAVGQTIGNYNTCTYCEYKISFE